MKRYFKANDGRWLAAVRSVDAAQFHSQPSSDDLDALARSVGVDAVTFIDVDTDPRSGPLLSEPVTPRPPDPRVALRAELAAATTIAQLKAVLEKMLA